MVSTAYSMRPDYKSAVIQINIRTTIVLSNTMLVSRIHEYYILVPNSTTVTAILVDI